MSLGYLSTAIIESFHTKRDRDSAWQTVSYRLLTNDSSIGRLFFQDTIPYTYLSLTVFIVSRQEHLLFSFQRLSHIDRTMSAS